MDMGQLLAAANSLKVAGDIAISLINLKSMNEVQTKAIELNAKILQAQHDLFAANAAQAALFERVRELEGQIARLQDWEREKQRYKLTSPYRGPPGSNDSGCRSSRAFMAFLRRQADEI